MQTLVQVVCTKGPSLRDLILNDNQRSRFGLVIESKKKKGRPDGWAKLSGNEPGWQGALNIEWDAATTILWCRIVNRGKGRPSEMLGHFMHYLFKRWSQRIEAVNIIPR